MSDGLEISQIRAVKDKYEKRLLRKRNVVGVGIGFRYREGEQTEELALTVMVRQKLSPSELRPRDRIPSELDGVPVDVQEVGEFRAL
jgi:hypothetical protein